MRTLRHAVLTAFVATAGLMFSSCGGGISGSVPAVSVDQGRVETAELASASASLYVPNSGSFSVTVYPALAHGNVAPSQDISGSNTMFRSSLGISGTAIDRAGNLIVSTGFLCLLTFPHTATGNVHPTKAICGENTGISDSQEVAIDPSGDIVVANETGGFDGLGNILTFAPSANGNVKPLFTLEGAHTGLLSPVGVAFDAAGKLYVSNFDPQSITVYAAGHLNGDVAPIATITGSKVGLTGVGGIALDKSGNIYVANGATGGSVDNFVAEFRAGSNGNVSPIRKIAGPRTQLTGPLGIAVLPCGTIYVTNVGTAPTGVGSSVVVFSATANGDAPPLRVLSGSNTKLNSPRFPTVH